MLFTHTLCTHTASTFWWSILVQLISFSYQLVFRITTNVAIWNIVLRLCLSSGYTHTHSQEATLQFKINSISNLYHFFIFIFAWFWCATTAHFAENEKENATKGWRKEWEREYWLAVRDWIVTCHLPLAKRWGQIFGFHKLNSFEEFSFDLCGMVRCGVVWCGMAYGFDFCQGYYPILWICMHSIEIFYCLSDGWKVLPRVAPVCIEFDFFANPQSHHHKISVHIAWCRLINYSLLLIEIMQKKYLFRWVLVSS